VPLHLAGDLHSILLTYTWEPPNNAGNIRYTTGNRALPSGHGAEVAGNVPEVVGHEAEVAGNVPEVVGNEVKVAGHEAEVAGHEAEVVGNGAEVAGNVPEVAWHGVKVAGNVPEVVGNGVKVAGNRVEISGNAPGKGGKAPEENSCPFQPGDPHLHPPRSDLFLENSLTFDLANAIVCFRIGGNMKRFSRNELKRLAGVLLVLVAVFAIALVVVNFMSPQVSGGARFGTDYTVVIGNVEYFDCHGIARNCVVVWP